MSWIRILIACPILFLFGCWLVKTAIGALRRCEANAAGTSVRFRDRPFVFLLAVIVQFGFGALALWQALMLLLASL